MTLKFLSFLILSYYCLNRANPEDVTISPYLNAFKVYQKRTYFQRKVYSYINPSIHNFNVTLKLGKEIKQKQFTKSDLTVTIHTDRYQYYDLEKTESYTIYTICKLNYYPEVIYLYQNICCRITIQDFNFTGNDFYSIKYCKYILGQHSSACFSEILFHKSFISKSNRADHVHFGLRAFAFATNSDECNMLSDVKEILAVSKLYPLSFSNGLSVFWTNIFDSNMNISLEIGRPFQSLDPDNISSLPVKLITEMKFSYLKIKCFISRNLEIKSVNFDETVFEAGYEISVLENEMVVTVMLQNKGTNYQKSSQWWIGRGMLLFIMNGRISDGSTYSRTNLQYEAWTKCQIVSYKKFSENKAVSLASDGMKKIPIAINTGKFIIIPILKEKSYFSIFNDISDPITLEDRFITLYSIHNVRDGSFVDVSNSVTCDPVDKMSIICPPSMRKWTNEYFYTKMDNLDYEKDRITPYKFDLILQMKTWKAVIFSPINFWISQDWRLDIDDKVLNKIKGWRIPVRSVITKELICVMLFQKTSIRVLARLANRNTISEREYYGSNFLNDSPLLDLTEQMKKESIEFSLPNSGISYNEKSSELLVDPQSGSNDIDVKLLSTKDKRLLAIDRVKITLDKVAILTIKLFCVSSFDLYEDQRDILSNFRQLIMEYTLANDTKKYCYLFIVVIFTDFSELRLDTVSSSYYKTFVSQFDYSNQKYVEIPMNPSKYIPYSQELNISIYESDICQNPKLIFRGLVKVNYQKEKELSTVPNMVPLQTTTTESPISEVTKNGNHLQNTELIMNLSSLYYGLYALIALVSLVALIVLINCLVKFNYRKISHQRPNTINQSANNKLLNSTQSQPIVDTSPTFHKHPPLLPPPGPLRNASESEVELASSTFWSNCSQDSASLTNRKFTSTTLEQAIPLTPLNNFAIRTSPLVSSVYTNTKYRHNPSPSSDQGDGGYLSGENQNKFAAIPLMKKSSEERNINIDTSDVTTNKHSLITFSDTYPVPPCPPLKWSIQWGTNMVSTLPIQPCTTNLITDSTCVITRTISGPGSTSWITNKPLQSSISVPYTKSIDNLCEKSSGLGSLTSTQQEDYSILSDDDNYHVSINSDKEHYRKYPKKC